MIPLKSVTPSHTCRGRGRPRGAAAGSRQHTRSDAELGWSEFDHYPDTDVFCGYSGISDISEIDSDSDLTDFFLIISWMT